MSDVRTFQGHDGNNSSRVLAPPGGASSIFFGDSAPAPAPRQQQPRAGSNDSKMSNTPWATTENVSPNVAAPAHGKRTTNMHGSHDTALEAGKHRAVHTSSRVLNPPGGKCHNIFG